MDAGLEASCHTGPGAAVTWDARSSAPGWGEARSPALPDRGRAAGSHGKLERAVDASNNWLQLKAENISSTSAAVILLAEGRVHTSPLARRFLGMLRLDPLLFFKPAHPAFQARFRQTACSASHSNLWFTSPHTMSLMRSYVFSGFRYLSPMIRHVLTLRIACST